MIRQSFGNLLVPRSKRFLNVFSFNVLVWFLLALYLAPVFFLIVTAMMPTAQLGDKGAPLYPSRIIPYEYEGVTHQLYNVPTADGIKQWALINPGLKSSVFIDPAHPQDGLIAWTGNWHLLKGVYQFYPSWDSFVRLFTKLEFFQMLRNTFLITMIGEIGVLVSSIIVAYGFARFSLPGGNLLFYILIATILIPDKVTFIPAFYIYVVVLHWQGTILPLVVHLFFGNAVYIFLLRQNFKSIPIDLEEAAMLDGAGPLRRLFSVILPQSWHVVITVALLHLFYMWNETRFASLYLGTNSALFPLSMVVQYFQSRIPIQNVIQAGAVGMLVIPVFLLFLLQRYFMQSVIITGAENNR